MDRRLEGWLVVLAATLLGCGANVAAGADGRAGDPLDAALAADDAPADVRAEDTGFDGDSGCRSPLQWNCGGDCVYVSFHPYHCGACGRRCPSGASCSDGECRCSGVVCGDACVNPATSAEHCGRCGHACPDGLVCREGSCACPALTCGGACVDPQTDAAHCGACGRACAASERCVGGVCACAVEGRGSCAGVVCGVDLRADARHCGACGLACDASQRCLDGRCARQCPRGAADCDRDPAAICEVFTAADDAHCGACGNACPAGTRCAAGRCVPVGLTMRAPGSALGVTSARPWFRWALAGGADGARVQVCADRACARVEAQAEVTGTAYRPTEPLPPGVHFWRAFARRGGAFDAAAGPTWEFVVPGAGVAWDLASNGLHDYDGDGVEDRVTVDNTAPQITVRVAYGRPPGGSARPESTFLGPGSWDASASARTDRRGRAFAAGDVHGDGFADLGVWYVSVTLYSGQGPYPSGQSQFIFGSAAGLSDRATPVRFSTGSMAPVPELQAARALGDFDGVGGGVVLLATHDGSLTTPCDLRRVSPRTMGTWLPGGAFDCAPSTFTSGDFDADGEVEALVGAPAQVLRRRGATATVARWDCDAVPGALSATWRRSAADVNLDGYDDLVFEGTGGRGREVISGGSAGLDRSRCAARP